MSEAAEKLKPLLDALTAEERVEILEYIHTLNGHSGDEEKRTDEEWEAEWADEINHRIADFESGKTAGIPHEEVMRRMKEKYG